MIGKYTYYRKKKLPRKKLGSSQHPVPLDAGVRSQSAEKSRKHAAGDVSDTVEVQIAVVSPKKLGPNKSRTELSVNAKSPRVIIKSSLPGDRSSTKKTSGQKGMKVARTVQSMSLFFITYFGSLKFLMIMNLSDINTIKYFIR
jgi:hypothetical protein